MGHPVMLGRILASSHDDIVSETAYGPWQRRDDESSREVILSLWQTYPLRMERQSFQMDSQSFPKETSKAESMTLTYRSMTSSSASVASYFGDEASTSLTDGEEHPKADDQVF